MDVQCRDRTFYLGLLKKEQSIHLREKNIAGPTERSAMHMHCLARREGPAFFDEDDVCAGFRIFDTACLNCHHQKSRAAVRRQPCCSLI